MMNLMNRQFGTALFLSLLMLTGCGGAGNAPSPADTAAQAESTAESAAAETSAASEETEKVIVVESEIIEETSPEEDVPPAEGMVRSPLTHLWIPEELAKKRPIAVMYPIDKKAQPQYGLNRVDVFYEIMEEGDMSRQMGVIQDWEDLGRIGNVRSIRDYFVYEALEWDSIIVHYGGPELFVKPILTRKDVENVNGVGGVMGPDYGAYYRIPKGSKSEHTAYTDGEHLLKAIEKAGWSREHREEYWQPDHWKFASDRELYRLEDHPDAVDATEIDMKGSYPVTKPTMTYKDGLYYRNIYGSPQKDGKTGEQMAFSNILIENCVSGRRGGSLYLYFHVLDSMHEGYFITGGKMIHCTWMKNADYETTRFFDDNGEEITLNPGKTMVFITQEGKSSFTVNGTKYQL